MAGTISPQSGVRGVHIRADLGNLSVGYTPDNMVLWTAGGEGKVRFWNAITREPMRSFIQHQTTVYGVAVTPDGKTVLTGSADGRARLWELLPRAEPSHPARRCLDFGSQHVGDLGADGRELAAPGRIAG